MICIRNITTHQLAKSICLMLIISLLIPLIGICAYAESLFSKPPMVDQDILNNCLTGKITISGNVAPFSYNSVQRIPVYIYDSTKTKLDESFIVAITEAEVDVSGNFAAVLYLPVNANDGQVYNYRVALKTAIYEGSFKYSLSDAIAAKEQFMIQQFNTADRKKLYTLFMNSENSVALGIDTTLYGKVMRQAAYKINDTIITSRGAGFNSKADIKNAFLSAVTALSDLKYIPSVTKEVVDGVPTGKITISGDMSLYPTTNRIPTYINSTKSSVLNTSTLAIGEGVVQNSRFTISLQLNPNTNSGTFYYSLGLSSDEVYLGAFDYRGKSYYDNMLSKFNGNANDVETAISVYGSDGEINLNLSGYFSQPAYHNKIINEFIMLRGAAFPSIGNFIGVIQNTISKAQSLVIAKFSNDDGDIDILLKKSSDKGLESIVNWDTQYYVQLQGQNSTINNKQKIFIDIFNKQRSLINNLAEVTGDTALTLLQNAYNQTSAISAVNFADRDSLTSCLKQHHTLFGIDLNGDYTKVNPVDVNIRILSNVDLSNVSDLSKERYYSNISEVKAAFDNAVKELLPKVPVVNPGAGPSGGNSSWTVSPKNNVLPKLPNPTEKPSFNDISDAAWASEAINKLAAKGIIAGLGDGSFKPGLQITREQFVKVIVSAFNLQDNKAEANFLDVNKDDWSYVYIASAVKHGIINGVDNNYFGVGLALSRQDMAVIIHRVMKYKNLDVKETNNNALFADSDIISGYAKDSVNALYSAGIIKGMNDGRFVPNEKTTRAQAATIIYNILKITGQES